MHLTAIRLPLMDSNRGHGYDDYRRADNDRGWAWWRPMPAMMSVPAALRNHASGRGEEGENAGEQQEFFHIRFRSLSGAKLRGGIGLRYGV